MKNVTLEKEKQPIVKTPPKDRKKNPKCFRWDEETNEDDQECPKFFSDNQPQSVYEQNWQAIRSHSSQGKNQLMISLRWKSYLAPNRGEGLKPIFLHQKKGVS